MPQPATQSRPTLGKKDLKRIINSNGSFAHMDIVESLEKSDNKFPEQAKSLIVDKYDPETAKDILENAVYIKATSSTGDVNRNGYIIRANAWVDAVEGYMRNPVVLLQHDTHEIIGECFSARVVGNKLITESYVFPDQMSEQNQKRFKRKQLKGISTGHMTLSFEWENTKTGEVLTREEFRALDWNERFDEAWVFAVTELEWVEQSVVTLPSNRDSMVEAMKNSIAEAKINMMSNEFGMAKEDVRAKMDEVVAMKKNEAEYEEPEEENEDGDEEKEESAASAIEVNDTPSEEAQEEHESVETESNQVAEEEETPTESNDTEQSGESQEQSSGEPAEESENNSDAEAEKVQVSRNHLLKARDILNNFLVDKEQNSSEDEEPEEGVVEESAVDTETQPDEPEAEQNSICFDNIETVCNGLDERGLNDVSGFVKNLYGIAENLKKEVDTLQNKIDSIPQRRALSAVGQFQSNGQQTAAHKNSGAPTLATKLKNAGVKFNY